MKFVAVDVEAANPNMSSICQIGMVLFEDGVEVRQESIFVNPQTWFDPVNIGFMASMRMRSAVQERSSRAMAGYVIGRPTTSSSAIPTSILSRSSRRASVAGLRR